MRAIVSYLKWVGKDVPRGDKAVGSGLIKLPFLHRPADTVRGKKVFDATCATCHQKNGSGLPQPDGGGYFYPPLWGVNSFNTAAGLYRISNMAGYVYANMPVGSTHIKPILSQEDAWDVAAYVVSRTRPHRTFEKDWPNLSSKPIDHPFGPYTDNFTEVQHKYGPFTEIEQARKSKN
jgi:thiosulfate dehydrogenase